MGEGLLGKLGVRKVQAFFRQRGIDKFENKVLKGKIRWKDLRKLVLNLKERPNIPIEELVEIQKRVIKPILEDKIANQRVISLAERANNYIQKKIKENEQVLALAYGPSQSMVESKTVPQVPIPIVQEAQPTSIPALAPENNEYLPPLRPRSEVRIEGKSLEELDNELERKRHEAKDEKDAGVHVFLLHSHMFEKYLELAFELKGFATTPDEIRVADWHIKMAGTLLSSYLRFYLEGKRKKMGMEDEKVNRGFFLYHYPGSGMEGSSMEHIFEDIFRYAIELQTSATVPNEMRMANWLRETAETLLRSCLDRDRVLLAIYYKGLCTYQGALNLLRKKQ